MREMIATGDVPHCEECGGLVKPEIVFFGEQLPAAFFLNRMKPAEADLCIVMGTSLTVQPFASLPGFCAEGTPRVLINKERAGSLGSRADDVLLLAFVREKKTKYKWVKEIEFIKEIPKSASGKILRRLLRDRKSGADKAVVVRDAVGEKAML